MKADSKLLVLATFIFLAFSDNIRGDGTEKDELDDDVYWPQVCSKVAPRYLGLTFVADKSFQTKQASSGFDQRLYLETFVDTVNLYFAGLRCHNVRIFLIEVHNSSDAEECLFERFKKTKESINRSLDASFTLGLFRKWTAEQSFFNNSDVVYLITGHPVYDFISAYRLKMKAASYAFGVCSKWKVALGSDDGETFSGVPAAAQQIANLLGISWDEKRNKPGCTPDDGHLMSKNGELTQLPTFSNCSKEKWDDLIQLSLSDEQSCFKLNISALELSAEYKTPYDFFGCKVSCASIIPQSATSASNLPSGVNARHPDTCKESCCTSSEAYSKQNKSGAPDGMPCGPAQVCIQQVCINVTGLQTKEENACVA